LDLVGSIPTQPQLAHSGSVRTDGLLEAKSLTHRIYDKVIRGLVLLVNGPDLNRGLALDRSATPAMDSVA
jgi:hypothetical protein